MVWNLFPFKSYFNFWESQKFQGIKCGPLRGESPVWFDVSPKHSAQDMMHEWACCPDKAANHQFPTAVAFWIIQIVSTEDCSSFMQNLMQIRYSTCSVILNVMATQYTCSLSGIYLPHSLVQWSHHCSHIHIPVHFPWLTGYIDVTQTVLVILTMARLFIDRPWYLLCSRAIEMVK